jgi:hypothetical protein
MRYLATILITPVESDEQDAQAFWNASFSNISNF